MLEPTHNIDVPLLRKELEHITAHPERWNQSTWGKQTECGTVACLAGNAVIHNYPVESLIWQTRKFVKYDGTRMETLTALDGVTINCLPYSVHEVARDLFGLTEDQAGAMFSATNTLSDLWEYANQITNGEIEVPEEVKVMAAQHNPDRDL